MEEKERAELTDQELLANTKKIKSNSITNAVLIGFLIGIIIYSIAVNSVGLFTLIPLVLAYKLINNSNKNKT